MSCVSAGTTLKKSAWTIQLDDDVQTRPRGRTEKDSTNSCGDWLKIAARILLNSCQGIYTFDWHLLTDDRLLQIYKHRLHSVVITWLFIQLTCTQIHIQKLIHTHTHTHTHTHLCSYLEINEGSDPMIRPIKSFCQCGHAVIIVWGVMVMYTWFCSLYCNVRFYCVGMWFVSVYCTTVLEEVLRPFTQVKVAMLQCKNTTLQVEILYKVQYKSIVLFY